MGSLISTLMSKETGGAPSATSSHSVSSDSIPTSKSTGVPEGWQPKTERAGEYTIFDEGAVIEDLRLTNGVLYVRAPNVTLRRVELVSSRIVNDYGRDCFNGLRIEDSTILRGGTDIEMPAISSGGYTATRVKIDGPSEGFRIGEQDSGCGPVLIEDTWMKLAPPDKCDGAEYWHGDGVQAYRGPELTIRDSYINLAQTADCPGNAAFFYPDQENARATVENVVMSGGAFVFRLSMPGSVSGLKILMNSWTYGAVDVANCDEVKWGAGNELVAERDDGTLVPVEPLKCVKG